MYQYKVTFIVNGHRTEETITAAGSSQAREIIKARYAGSELSFENVVRL